MHNRHKNLYNIQLQLQLQCCTNKYYGNKKNAQWLQWTIDTKHIT